MTRLNVATVTNAAQQDGGRTSAAVDQAVLTAPTTTLGLQPEHIAKLTTSDGEEKDYFGDKLVISGKNIIVGAYGVEGVGVGLELPRPADVLGGDGFPLGGGGGGGIVLRNERQRRRGKEAGNDAKFHDARNLSREW